MAFYSLHTYDADVWIPEFKGLNQADVNMNPDMRYAAELENVETPNGVLQPRAGNRRIEGYLSKYITMLARFHRRYYTGSGTKEWFICFAGDHFYYRQGEEDVEWTSIDPPTGVTFGGKTWSHVCYENTETGNTVDIMLVSNGDDGMFMIIPPDRPSSWNDIKAHDWDWVRTGRTWQAIKSPSWSMQTVDTLGKKFGVIERYADRIWGADIADNPDMLMYSKPYDPTDWNADTDNPEDGGGDILQPSWDGDRFTGLKHFGDSLIAVKEHHIWRIVGTNPGVFEFREQYGGGTKYGGSIAIWGERLFMAGEDGISVYDGMSVSMYRQKETEKQWKYFTENISRMTSIVFDNRYYLSSLREDEEDGGMYDASSSTFVVNLAENTILYYPDSFAHHFMEANNRLYASESFRAWQRIPDPRNRRPYYYINRCYVSEFRYDSFSRNSVFTEASKWISPWIDFGYKRIQKGGFDLYFVPEVRNKEATLYFTIQTEKKKKTKAYTIKPLTAEQKAKPKEHRGKRLHFGGMGRKFRIIIETKDTPADAPWRLIGGLQLVVETDPD